MKGRRWDSLDIGKWMTTPFSKTPEGFLTGKAIVTSVGVFTYLNADGSTRRELRLPQEVFSEDSLNSMKLKPLTNDHPSELLTSGNAKTYQVGTLGSDPSSWIDGYGTVHPEEQGRGYSSGSDGFHVSISMTITDASAIQDVALGKTALSMGYDCEIEEASAGATWCGVAYDCIQRNIRYNHCAIVDIARAGDAARIRMDRADAIQIQQKTESKQEINSKKEINRMKKVTIDGIEYEGEDLLVMKFIDDHNKLEAAGKALDEMKKELDEKEKKLSALEAEKDANKDRADKAEKSLKEAKEQALDNKRLDEAVNARIALLDAASRAEVEVKDGMTDLEIKKAVITSLYPTAKLDGKDDVYICARFDAVLEDLDSRADSSGREISLGEGFEKNKGDSNSNRVDSAASHQRMVERMKERSRGEKKQE